MHRMTHEKYPHGGCGLEDKAAQGLLVSDELWERIKPLLPEHKNAHRFGGGRPRKDDRTCLDGILFVLRTGCQWKALSATGICPSSTAHDRFQEWVRAGVFLKFWTAGLMAYDALKASDSTMSRCGGCWRSSPSPPTSAPAARRRRRSGRKPASRHATAVVLERCRMFLGIR
jgi:putative transposase